MLSEAFGNFEELQKKVGGKYELDCEVELVVEHKSGRPSVLLCPSRELLTDVGVPFDKRFRDAIEQARGYINNKEGLGVIRILTGGVDLREVREGKI